MKLQGTAGSCLIYWWLNKYCDLPATANYGNDSLNNIEDFMMLNQYWEFRARFLGAW